MMHVATPLASELEALVTRIIGCCIQVHRELGPGLLERIYHRAVCLELAGSGIAFETQRTFPVFYRGQLLCEQRVDLIVESQVLIEIKAQERLQAVHHAQIQSYLRISKLKIGLLLNFNEAVLPNGLKRFVMS